MKEINSVFENDNPRIKKDEYREFLERLRIEIGDFLKDAEMAEFIRYSGLKARKKSVQLRKLLKLYRVASLKHEKKLNKLKYKGIKPEIHCNEEIYENVEIK